MIETVPLVPVPDRPASRNGCVPPPDGAASTRTRGSRLPGTALVVIDMGPAFVEANPYVRSVIPNIDRLAGVLRAIGGQILWVVPANEAPLGDVSDEFYSPRVQRYVRGDLRCRSPLHARLWHAVDARPQGLVVEKNA